MRDLEENSRNIANRNKRDRGLDEPTVRRRGPSPHAVSRRRNEEDDYEERESRYSRASLENDDEDTFEQQLRRRTTTRNQYQDDFDDEEELRIQRAPLLVRLFAWIAVLIIFFACGYVGANYFFSWADKRNDGIRIGNVVGSGTEVTQIAKEKPSPVINAKSASYTIYIPEDGKFTSRTTDIKKGQREEDATQIVSMYIDVLKENNIFNNDVRLLNVFTSGDWMYIDMTPALQASLKKLSKKDAAFALTGLLKTVSSNFPPVKKIKFYIDGKEATDKTPVDLTQPWEALK